MFYVPECSRMFYGRSSVYSVVLASSAQSDVSVRHPCCSRLGDSSLLFITEWCLVRTRCGPFTRPRLTDPRVLSPLGLSWMWLQRTVKTPSYRGHRLSLTAGNAQHLLGLGSACVQFRERLRSGVGVRPGSRASPGPFPKWWHRVTLPPPCLCVPGPRQRFVSPSQTSATPTASQRPGTTFRFVSPVSGGPLKRMQIKRSGACSPTLCKI